MQRPRIKPGGEGKERRQKRSTVQYRKEKGTEDGWKMRKFRRQKKLKSKKENENAKKHEVC